MKTNKQVLLRAILLCMIILSNMNLAQAQSPSGPWWDGLKEGLENFVNDLENSPEAKEAWRWMTIYNTDIQMWMEGGVSSSSGVSKGKESVYAEFDWDNLAEKLVVTGIERSGPVVNTLYTDKAGNLYSPYEGGYIKINVPKLMLDLNGSIDIMGKTFPVQELLKANMVYLGKAVDLVERLIGIVPDRTAEDPYGWAMSYLDIIYHFIYFSTGLKPGFIDQLEDAREDLNAQEFSAFLLENGLSEGLADMLANLQRAGDMSNIVGFPVFIHWAMLYSSETLKGQFPVTESEVGCPDGGTGCNKFTVSSGKERGKSMTFDQFGRLVYIDALKDGFVRYSYDMDLTVNLPPAITFQEAVNQHR